MVVPQKKRKHNNIIVFFLSLTVAAMPLTTHAVEFTREQATIQREHVARFSETDFRLNLEHRPGEILVKFAPDTPESFILQTIEDLNATVITLQKDGYAYVQLNNVFREKRSEREERGVALRNERGEPRDDAQEQLAQALSVLESHPAVQYAEPNFVAHALSVPDDPYYAYQWNFTAIGTEAAWEYATGKDVIIAVLDTGIAYEDYAQYRRADDLRGTTFVPGYNFIRNSDHANDDNGHGTHVAGTIAGSSFDNFGVAGIAYNARVMPVKVLDKNGVGGYAHIAAGIRFAADNNARVINISLGGPAPSQTLYDALIYAQSKGVLIVAASGNEGKAQLLYPAAYTNEVLAVGAIRYDKQRATYSNYGTGLDVVAPGGDVSVDQNNDTYPDGILQHTLTQSPWGANTRSFTHYFYQGTSMAAPHVTGIAALIMSLGVTDVHRIEEIIKKSAQDLAAPGWDTHTGHGLVRADSAVLRALEYLSETSQDLTLDSNTREEENGSALPQKNEQNTQGEPPQIIPATPKPEENVPQETTPDNEPKKIQLNSSTYNMWGRADERFAFWEKAYLGIQTNDTYNKPIESVDMVVSIQQPNGTIIAQGAGSTDNKGELWLQLGNFAKGTYTVLVKAVKDGFSSISDTVQFVFR